MKHVILAVVLASCVPAATPPPQPAWGAQPTAGAPVAAAQPTAGASCRGTGRPDSREAVRPGAWDYGQRSARVALYPPISVRGDLGAAFMAEWQQMIVASGFKTQVVPVGMRRRLASGLALIYDGGTMDM